MLCILGCTEFWIWVNWTLWEHLTEELWAMKLGLKLLQERAKVGSFWWPYISNLPETYSVPIFFPGEDIKNLQYAPLLHQVCHLSSLKDNIYNVLKPKLLKCWVCSWKSCHKIQFSSVSSNVFSCSNTVAEFLGYVFACGFSCHINTLILCFMNTSGCVKYPY